MLIAFKMFIITVNIYYFFIIFFYTMLSDNASDSSQESPMVALWNSALASFPTVITVA